jgi:hypothetical protein
MEASKMYLTGTIRPFESLKTTLMQISGLYRGKKTCFDQDSKRSEDLRLYNVVQNSTISNPSLKTVFLNASPAV